MVKKSGKSPTGRKSVSPKSSKQRSTPPSGAAAKAANRGDGYEADTDDTLSRQQRKSVKELAR